MQESLSKSRCRFSGKGLELSQEETGFQHKGSRSDAEEGDGSCTASPWLHPVLSCIWELLKHLTKHLDPFLASKYFWHFSPFLLHQPLHLWKENIFTSLPGWLLGLAHSWVWRAGILHQRQEQKPLGCSSLCTQHGNVPALWQGSLLGLSLQHTCRKKNCKQRIQM